MEDGRATRIQGDPEHPVTRGFLCAESGQVSGSRVLAERVLSPMRRVNPKGTGFAPSTPGVESLIKLEWMVLCVPELLPRGSIGHDSVAMAEI
jgi:hypothetical protein